jgi:hydroxymethylpyrimidine pyrophosphatase-like HAD family hydrolase
MNNKRVLKKWDPDFAKRKRVKALLGELISDLSVRLGGTTSIDITKPGIDKAYGIPEALETKRLTETILACSSGVSRARASDEANDTLTDSR